MREELDRLRAENARLLADHAAALRLVADVRAASSATGDRSASSATGYRSASSATGAIVHIRAAVAGKEVKADTWYSLTPAGDFVEASP